MAQAFPTHEDDYTALRKIAKIAATLLEIHDQVSKVECNDCTPQEKEFWNAVAKYWGIKRKKEER